MTSLESIVNKELIKFSKSGKTLWDDFYAQIAGVTRDIGIPEPAEILASLNKEVDIVDGKIFVENQRVTKIANDAIQAVMTGAKPADAALKDAQAEAERVLKDFN